MIIGIPIAVISLAIVVIGVLLFVARNYRKCPPNEVLVIYGWGRKVKEEGGKVIERGYRLVTGGSAFIFPLLEAVKSLSLNTIQIDLDVTKTPNVDGVLVDVNAVANIKISSDPAILNAAAERLLGMTPEESHKIAKSTMEGHLRQIVGTLGIEQMVKERETISQKVIEIAQSELNKLGFTLDNFVITKITDGQGYIEALGRKKTAEVKRDADVGVAEAEKESMEKSSEARKDGQKKKLENDAFIALAEKDLAVKKAEYKKDTEIADASASLARQIREVELHKELEQKKVEIEQGKALAQKELVTAQIEVATKEVERKQKELEATEIKPADAKKQAAILEAEGKAQAIKNMADAEKEKRTKEGEGEAAAEAAKKREVGKAEGEAIEARGKAEGESIKAKALGEAEGLKKKNEALASMTDSARLIIILDRLPQIIEKGGEAGEKVIGSAFEHIGAGLSRIDNLTMVDLGGNSDGKSPVERYALSIPKIVFGLVQEAKALGIDFDDVLKKLGIDASKIVGALEKKETHAGPEAEQ